MTTPIQTPTPTPTTPAATAQAPTTPLRMTANGQHVRVKRLTDTYFISLDIRHGASVKDLYQRTAYAMGVDIVNLRLCLLKADGQVDFLPQSGEVMLNKTPFSFELCGRPEVYAVFRINGQWEQPCTVDFPSTSSMSTCTSDDNTDPSTLLKGGA